MVTAMSLSGPTGTPGRTSRNVPLYSDKDTFEINKDGKKKKLPGFPGELSRRNGYSNNFLTYTHDFNADGWMDVLVFGWPGKNTTWYENPKNKEGLWPEHHIFQTSNGESPRLEDMDNDGNPELLLHSGGRLGYVRVTGKTRPSHGNSSQSPKRGHGNATLTAMVPGM